MRCPALILSLAVLVACTVGDAPVIPPPASGDACGASGLQSLVGQPAALLETMRFGVPVRVIRPGMAVTMDYRADRLDIEIDRRETISRVTCG